MIDLKISELNHLGLVAGIIDEIGLVDVINQCLGTHWKEKVSAGLVVKAMVINALGFLSSPLYLFSQWFENKATSHLLGEEVDPKDLNDDRLGRVLDQLYAADLSQVFLAVSLAAAEVMQVSSQQIHLDSTSISVEGEYEKESGLEALQICHGYSRDRRPDLKQFVMGLICSGDGDVPIGLRIGNGNESDKTSFVPFIQSFRQQWTWDEVEWVVADSSLYSASNIKKMQSFNWVSRVPASLKEVKSLWQREHDWQEGEQEGYRLAAVESKYGGVKQRWILVESRERRKSDQDKLIQQLQETGERLAKEWQQLCRQEFHCEADAKTAVERFKQPLKEYEIVEVEVLEQEHRRPRTRSKKTAEVEVRYQIKGVLVGKLAAVEKRRQSLGRFVLAVHQKAGEKLSDSGVLRLYKEQQGVERGFRFIKDPLFFASSVYVKKEGRVAAIGMLMGLSLLVYSLGQRRLRQKLAETGGSVRDQKQKPTQKPTLRWIFQLFQGIHLVQTGGKQDISGLSTEREQIIQLFGPACGRYYLLV